MTLLKQQGMDAVNVKTLAGALHCSTQPIYLSFRGMDDLRAQLTPLAVKEFESSITEKSRDSQVRLYDMGYLRFAKDEPKLFCFLFMRSNAFTEMKRLLTPIIERSISDLMERYQISHKEADSLHDHLWMHAHGIAAMIATDFCTWDLKKANRMLDECTAVFTKEFEVE